MNQTSNKGTWIAGAFLPDISEEQLRLALERLEEIFPGTWEKMMWERQQPFPKDKLPELRKVSKETVSSLWALVNDMEFVNRVQNENERRNLSRALINAINQRANDQAQEANNEN